MSPTIPLLFLLILSVFTQEDPSIQYCTSTQWRNEAENAACQPSHIPNPSTSSIGIPFIRVIESETQVVVLRCRAKYPIRLLAQKPAGNMHMHLNERTEKDSYVLQVSVQTIAEHSRTFRCEAYNDSALASEVYLQGTGAQSTSPLSFVTTNAESIQFFVVNSTKEEYTVPCILKSGSDGGRSLQDLNLVKSARSNKILNTISDGCLSCLCRGTGYGDRPCGWIGGPYWLEAWEVRIKSPSLLNPDNNTPCSEDPECAAISPNFFDCIRNESCAQMTIRKYMERNVQSLPDCNGDGVSTCVDFARVHLLGKSECSKSINRNDHSQFIQVFPDCLQKLNEAFEVVRTLGYAAGRGFQVEGTPDFTMTYTCSHLGSASSVVWAPLNADQREPGILKFSDAHARSNTAHIFCEMSRPGPNVKVKVGECTNIAHCDLLFQPYREFSSIIRSHGDSGVFDVSQTTGSLPPVNHGYVECSGVWENPGEPRSHFVREFGYIFTGLDHHKYLVGPGRQDPPPSAVIQLTAPTLKALNSSTPYDFDCTVSTFLLSSNIHFLIEYENGKEPTKVWRDSFVDGQRKIIALEGNRTVASATWRLKMKVPAGAKRISCHAPYINSNEWAVDKRDIRVAPDDSSNLALWILLPLVAVLILAVVIIMVLWSKYAQAKRLIRDLTEEEIDEFYCGSGGKAPDGALPIENMAFKGEKIIPAGRVTIKDEVLGEGQFGVVNKGEYINLTVAVKSTKSSADIDYFKAFLKELKVMAYIGEHENIVEFYGAVVDNIKARACLAVIELAPFGNLNSYLRKHCFEADSSVKDEAKDLNQGLILNHSVLVSFCAQIAKGMEFLALKKVTHGDLATRNVLLFEGNRVKITDFGLSRKLYGCANYVKKQQAPLPWRWMALETLRYLEFSSESDVWSFGVTAWEIFSGGQVPFSALTWTVAFVEELQAGKRLPKPSSISDSSGVYEMMLRCWDNNPKNRPSFKDLWEFFVKLENSLEPQQVEQGKKHQEYEEFLSIED